MSVHEKSCVPPDPFWELNRALAETLWQRGDGATVSTRLAQPIADLFAVPLPEAKAVLHGAMAVGATVAASKTVHPIVGIAVGIALYAFLEQDRCE